MTAPRLKVNWPMLSDALALGLVLLDGKGRVLHWNAWISRYAGIALADAQGHTLEEVFPEALSAPFRKALGNALRHRLPIVLSNVLHHAPLPLYARPEHRHGDQRLPQSVTITPVAQPGAGHLCLLQVTDTSTLATRERVLQLRSDRLSREAVVDGLTGIYNRKYLDDKLRAELERAQRSQIPVALVMFDVDSFKAYNDTYGHPAGDRVLVAIAHAAREQINRVTDVLARYGGEEFAAVLPASDKIGAQRVAEKIRSAVEALAIPHQASSVSPCVTVSLGVACHDPRDGYPGAHELLELADRALYVAKRNGRNQVRWTISSATPLDIFPVTQR
ncbi:GGDEF domain-containing protein [Pseudorhodoferax sp. Leaf265]|jgi:diguanylate cyclase (GGDEF)-like protein|uniref:GGDEF domain-containing protein n=1 Tax=Pseudorhodoferax sp. Leaf265 TaxID=1736315 RepID=UPI0007C7286F|nr:GGDEF domain-containing protein [Pseudorhodoferax sp. Leaf265]PZP99959.1 MAG: GGDEF domain-containing protein [Variovorax paradoxus]PZQ12164.1 MAG: GGDEF domain-containing protein [Variovorax paradoxus]